MLASHYHQILLLHAGCAALSGTLFAGRGVLRILDRPLAGHRALRLASYLIDTLLLTGAVLLMLIIHQYPLVDGWLTVKLLLLLVYIALGMTTLKWARTRSGRIIACSGALLTFCAIVAVAVGHTHWRAYALARIPGPGHLAHPLLKRAMRPNVPLAARVGPPGRNEGAPVLHSMRWGMALVWLAGAAVAAPAALAVGANSGTTPGDFGPPRGAVIHAVLTSPPAVPPPIHRNHPARVIVELEVREVEKEISEGVTYTFWTFGGTTPGSFIRVRQGDTVEFHLKNHPDNKMPHNIDLHGVTGPGGGAASSFTAPGHESQFTFKALNQGIYVYHCATAPVGMHIANGMYGLMLVEPPGGMKPVDHEYYVMQGDFYTVGKYRERGHQDFDMQRAIDERPTYVLFNGSEGSLVGEHALKAKVGDRVRLFVGNGGPNLVSSFHVIGAIFDRVRYEGGLHEQQNVQTTLIPSGGAAIVEFHVRVPGSYVLVDHSILRAFNKGALAILKADGPEDKTIYSGKEVDSVYLGDKAANLAAVSEARAAEASGTLTREQQIKAGESRFTGTCSVCHQGNGAGLPNVFPPLAHSDFLMADKQRAIGIVLNGLSGKVTVNGNEFNSVMPPMSQLNDDELANILTFVRNSWGNSGEAVSADEVRQMRAASGRPEGAAH